MVRAAVLPAVGAPLEITDIVLPEPGPGQVRIALAAAGVCHSDLSLSNGTMRVPVPAVLGHEGATRFCPSVRASRMWPPATAWSSTGPPPAGPASTAGSARCGSAPTP